MKSYLAHFIEEQLIIFVVDFQGNIIEYSGVDSIFDKKSKIDKIDDIIAWEETNANRPSFFQYLNSFNQIITKEAKSTNIIFCYIKHPIENKMTVPVFFYLYRNSPDKVVLVGHILNDYENILFELVCNFPLILYAHDLNGVLKFIGEGVRRIGIKNKSEVTNKNINYLLSPESGNEISKIISKWKDFLSGDRLINDESMKRRFGVSVHPLQVKLRNFKDDGKNYIPFEYYPRAFKIKNENLVMGVLRSLERQQANISKLLNIFDKSEQPIYRYIHFPDAENKEEEFRFSYVNQAFAVFLKYNNPSELINKTIFSVFYENDFEEIYNKVYRRYHLQRVEICYKHRLRCKDNSTKKVFVHAFPFIYHSDKALFVQGSLYDLTKEEEYYSKLIDTNRKLKSMSEISKDVYNDENIESVIKTVLEASIQICDGLAGWFLNYHKIGNIVRLIPVYAAGIGIDEIHIIEADQYLKNRIYEFCDNTINILDDDTKAYFEIDAVEKEVKLLAVGIGTPEEPFGIYIIAIDNNIEFDSNIKYVYNYFADLVSNRISKEKLFEEENYIVEKLSTTNKQITLGEIAWEITHEVGNAINNIPMGLEKLFNDTKIRQSSEALKTLEEIEKITDRAIELINNFKNWYNFPKSDTIVLDLNELTTEVIARLKYSPRVKKGKVNIIFNKSGDLPNISASKIRTSEILVNIILNAIQAIPKNRKGQITISTGTINDEVFVKVTDNGTGIKINDFNKIMTRFTTKEHGSGLGLYVSQRFINEARGHIEYKNNKEGSGATFEIYFPKGEMTDA